MTAALVTVDFLEAVSGVCADRGRAEVLLSAASDTLREASGQTISAATSTHTLRTFNGVMRFPERPVRNVVSVTVDGEIIDPSGYRWVAGGGGHHATLIKLDANGDDTTWDVASAEVEYAHGWITPPDSIRMAIANRVTATMSSSGGQRVSQVSIEGYSETRQGGAEPAAAFTPADLQMLGLGVPRMTFVPIGAQ